MLQFGNFHSVKAAPLFISCSSEAQQLHNMEIRCLQSATFCLALQLARLELIPVSKHGSSLEENLESYMDCMQTNISC